MTFERRLYRVKVQKRDGQIVEGEMLDDGLQSLWPVKDDAGDIHYVSVLDKFLSKLPIGPTEVII